MTKRNIILIVTLLILFTGCATVSKSNLYWGKYSHTLYELKKNPGEESKQAHIAELNSIVEKSKDLNLRVPPGIYSELGMYSQEKGDAAMAQNYFQLEAKTYPESIVLVKQLQSN